MSDDFLKICHERGFFHQCTDEAALQELLGKECVSAYIGFDCTAKSLHVGGLMQIMMLRWFQKCGHKPIVLMGGGTTKVGDPTGKEETRKYLTDADIQENMDGIKKVFEKFITFGDGPTDALMVNNDAWLSKLNYLEFLRDYGRLFSVNRMLSMDSVKQRLEREQHMTFLEFNYMILQAYDFAELSKHYGVRLQMGGSDQWGNIVHGVELGRRVRFQNKEWKLGKGLRGEHTDEDVSKSLHEQEVKNALFGMTSPLVTTSSGVKMGKTMAGAVWLNADMLSPYDYWQFWRNTEDGDVERFFKMFTELSISDITAIMSGNINDAKKRLATEATALLHGAKAAEEAAETARKIFEEGGVGGAMPEVTIDKAELEAGIPAFKLLHLVELVTSGKEGRRAVQSKSARVNDALIEAEDQSIGLKDMTADGYIKLSLGKKKHLLVRAA